MSIHTWNKQQFVPNLKMQSLTMEDKEDISYEVVCHLNSINFSSLMLPRLHIYGCHQFNLCPNEKSGIFFHPFSSFNLHMKENAFILLRFHRKKTTNVVLLISYKLSLPSVVIPFRASTCYFAIAIMWVCKLGKKSI